MRRNRPHHQKERLRALQGAQVAKRSGNLGEANGRGEVEAVGEVAVEEEGLNVFQSQVIKLLPIVHWAIGILVHSDMPL